jgi:hypothetical protein
MSKDASEVLREIEKVREARAYAAKKRAEAERLRMVRTTDAEPPKPETLDAEWWMRSVFGDCDDVQP